MIRIILLIILILFSNTLFAQVFYHLQFGRSSKSIGTGEQSSTLLDPVNAMAGNPANLTHENGITVSFFRNPYYYFFPEISSPLSNLVVSYNYQDKDYFGIEYSFWNLKGFIEQNYENTFSIGYARKISHKLSIGTKLTYGKSKSMEFSSNHLMFSAGLSFTDKLFGKDLNLGMSFMNFGDRVKLKIGSTGNDYGENPSLFILGFNYNLFSFYPGYINSLIEFRKGLLSHTNGVPDNSFIAFFKSWKKFDQFLKTNIGITVNSNLIQISNKLNYGIKYFIGYSTERYSGEYYNYGMQISLSYFDYSLGLGFGGRWYSARNYLKPTYLGYESFDITLNKKVNWNEEKNLRLDDIKISAKNFNISFGVTHSVPIGIWKKNYFNYESSETESFFSFESDMEIKLTKSISNINTFSYWKSKTKFINYNLVIDMAFYAILSGLSFYPFSDFDGFYLSTKLGVLRINPIPENVNPKYSNVIIIVFSSGYKLNLFKSNFQIVPYLNFVMFTREGLHKNNVYGFKKIDYGFKLGYQF